jgi:DNA recombination protein RmuC
MITITEGIILGLLVLIIIGHIILLFKKPKVNIDYFGIIEEIKKIDTNFDNKLLNLRLEFNNAITNLQTGLSGSLNTQISEESRKEVEKIDLLIQTLTQNLTDVKKAMDNNTLQTENRLDKIRENVERSIKSLEQENSKKLDEMRIVVDEKLQKTLEDKLSKSFQMVTENLNKVYESIGEMQSLAVGVGDLKKVLSNVKTRGMLGETQLANILEQILTKDQYDVNIVTKKGSKDPVEFAIKMPGDDSGYVYMPIDAKFPMDAYSTLLTAYDSGSSEEVKLAKASLIAKIKKFGKDIHEKYIDVPNTTDFGIMFLPVEGLYAEVVQTGVTEDLQRDYKINVAGPSTMAALLNSLQMGFRTIAIQKRTSEVWRVLGAVKTEFNNFEKVLEATQSKLNQASGELDKLVGVRTRQIQKKLSDVLTLPDVDSKKLLDNSTDEEI